MYKLVLAEVCPIVSAFIYMKIRGFTRNLSEPMHAIRVGWICDVVARTRCSRWRQTDSDCQFALLCENNYDVIHKIRSTQRIALPSKKERATDTGYIYRKIDEIWMCGYEICKRT